MFYEEDCLHGIFTNEELSRFLECTKNMPGSIQRKTVFYMLFSLLICTGLRLGEALRLKWTDIDWNSNPVMVSVIGGCCPQNGGIR